MIWKIEKKYFLIVLGVILLSFILIKQRPLKAEIVNFYPQNCLGSFINPEKAQGKPEVDSPDLINESNSAVYLGGFKEIYCGNFQGPEVKGEIKKITLHFNWVVTKQRREVPITEPTSTESNILEKIISPKTIEFEFNTSTTPTPETTSTATTSSLPEPSSTPEELPTQPQSFFLKFVFAQETTTSLETTPATESTTTNTQTETPTQTEPITQTINETQQSSSENQSEESSTTSTSTATSPVENQNEATTTPTTTLETTSTPTSAPPKTLFEVHYTLDGQNWSYLGSIKTQTYADYTQTYAENEFIPDISFEIPVNNWLDISKIQIKVNSLPETDYYLYLESMWFEIEYELPQATSTLSEITNFVGGTISSLTENFSNNTSTSSELSTSSDLSSSSTEEAEETEEISTSTALENITSTPQLPPLKKRTYTKEVKIQNPDNISCKVEPFSIEIKEEETKTANLIISTKNLKNIEIGSLPSGIDIQLENNDYEFQTSKDSIQLKIYRQKGSDKGNFNIPIIVSSGKSTIICQINVISF